MALFKHQELSEIVSRAIACGLALRRENLLFAFSSAFTASLSGWSQHNPADALRADANELNQLEQPIAGEIPFVVWLGNAHAMTSATRPADAQFFNEKALLAAERAAQAGGGAAGAGLVDTRRVPAITIPQVVLFRNDLLPERFFRLAAARAGSVARLTVFAYEGGQARLLPSGNPDGVFGTGWLIGPGHIMTNWHVITARQTGEAVPSDADIALQVTNMKIEFDYTDAAGVTHVVKSAGLACGNAALDYAIIALEQPEPRPVLPLLSAMPALSGTDPVAANIIQHPAGEPRQYGIRDNLAAVIDGDDLAYFTDTKGGSSGSPVCDDQWRVMALHKATTTALNGLSFQGKETAWINVGTVMPAIIADLQASHAPLWNSLGAEVV